MALAAESDDAFLMFYSDEDWIDSENRYASPYFKNSWDPELALNQNYFSRLAMFNTARSRAIGGFNPAFSSGWAYEFGLRYAADLSSKNIAHISEVIYHNRNAASLSFFGLYEESAREKEKLTELKASFAKTATVGGVNSGEASRSSSSEPTTVAIICDARENKDRFVDLFRRRWENAGATEIILLTRGEEKTDANIKYLSPDKNASFIEALNLAAENTEAGILGFVSPDLIPASDAPARRIASIFLRAGIGALAGKISYPNGKLWNGGYLADAEGVLKPIFKNTDFSRFWWFNWHKLTRSVDAIDCACLFTRKKLFEEFDGFKNCMESWAFQDYCLRLKQNGYSIIWDSNIRFQLS